MSIPAIVADWERGIREVQAAFAEVLRSIDAKSRAAAVQTPEDIQVVSRLWQVAKAEQHKHRERIDARWGEVLDLLAEQAPGEEVTQREGKKRDLGGLELEIACERASRTAMAHAGEKLLGAGQSPAHLQAVAHLIADAAAVAPWEEMTRANQAMSAERNRKDVPLAVLERFNDAARRYFQLRFDTEARYLPVLAPHVATKVDGQMETVTRQLKMFWQWRAAHP
jgi:hypothetical protein